MKCQKCGKELRFGTEQVGVDNRGMAITHRFSYCDECMIKIDLDLNPLRNAKKKESSLGIIALILTILGITSFIGLILAIIDLCKKDLSKKHICSCVAIGIFVLYVMVGVANTGSDNKAFIEQETKTITEESKNIEDVKNVIESAEEETTSQETEDEYKASCEEFKYKDVLRNPNDYVGKRIKISIEISSVHEASWLNDTKYYFGNSENEYGWYGDRYAIFDERYDSDLRLLSDDVITVYGEIAEPEYTSSLILASEEILTIKMRYVELISE